MATLEYFVVSESISIDQQTNRTSVFNILEEVRASRFPASISQAIALSSWNLEKSDEGVDFQIMLRIQLPGQENSFEFPLNFTGRGLRHRVYHRIEGLALEGPGSGIFEVLINGKHAATHTITIIQQDIPS